MQTGVVARPINFFGGLATTMWAVIGMAGWQYGSFATLLILPVATTKKGIHPLGRLTDSLRRARRRDTLGSARSRGRRSA